VFDDQQLEPSSPQRRSSPGSLAPRSLAAIRKARRGAPVLALVAMAIAAPLAAKEVTVRRGDTLSGIAAHEGVPMARLVAFNAIANPDLIFEGQVLRIPADGETTHVIQPGETLGQIARRYDTTTAALVDRNAIGDPDRIIAGRSLVIPDPLAATPTTVVAPAPTTVAPATPVAPAAAAPPNTAPPTTAPPTTAPPITAAPTTVPPTTVPATTAPPAPTAPPTTTPPTTPTPAPGVVVSTIWVVQQGDTVTSVAERVGLSPARLAEANRIAITTALTAGQYLFIPTR
jgi:LysM repeat protein